MLGFNICCLDTDEVSVICMDLCVRLNSFYSKMYNDLADKSTQIGYRYLDSFDMKNNKTNLTFREL